MLNKRGRIMANSELRRESWDRCRSEVRRGSYSFVASYSACILFDRAIGAPERIWQQRLKEEWSCRSIGHGENEKKGGNRRWWKEVGDLTWGENGRRRAEEGDGTEAGLPGPALVKLVSRTGEIARVQRRNFRLSTVRRAFVAFFFFSFPPFFFIDARYSRDCVRVARITGSLTEKKKEREKKREKRQKDKREGSFDETMFRPVGVWGAVDRLKMQCFTCEQNTRPRVPRKQRFCSSRLA